MKALERRIERLEQGTPDVRSRLWDRLSKKERALRFLSVMCRPMYPGATEADQQAADRVRQVLFPGVSQDQLAKRMEDERKERKERKERL